MTQGEALKLANEITEKIELLVSNANFYDNPTSKTATYFTLSILEMHMGVISLLNSYASSHSPILIRSMQELFVNFKCLIDDPQYLNQIHFDDANQLATIYKGMGEISEKDSKEQNEFKERLEKESRTIKSHRDNKIGYLTIKDKFKKAGLIDEYITYGLLCTFAHNNATTLLARHQGDSEMKFAHDLPLETFLSFINQSFGFLSRSIEFLPVFSNVTPEQVDKTLEVIADNLEKLNSKP